MSKTLLAAFGLVVLSLPGCTQTPDGAASKPSSGPTNTSEVFVLNGDDGEIYEGSANLTAIELPTGTLTAESSSRARIVIFARGTREPTRYWIAQLTAEPSTLITGSTSIQIEPSAVEAIGAGFVRDGDGPGAKMSEGGSVVLHLEAGRKLALETRASDAHFSAKGSGRFTISCKTSVGTAPPSRGYTEPNVTIGIAQIRDDPELSSQFCRDFKRFL